jgi:hypothetical protein
MAPAEDLRLRPRGHCDRPKTHALDRVATGTGNHHTVETENSSSFTHFSPVYICVPAREIPLVVLKQHSHLFNIQYVLLLQSALQP